MTDETPEQAATKVSEALRIIDSPEEQTRAPQTNAPLLAEAHQPTRPPMTIDSVDESLDDFELELGSYAARLNEVANTAHVTAAANKHAAAKAAYERSVSDLTAAQQRGRPKKPREPVFGEVSGPVVAPVADPHDPNSGLQRVRSRDEADELARAGHRIRSADMPPGYWFSTQRRRGQFCYVIPVTQESTRMLLRDGKTYYLLPD